MTRSGTRPVAVLALVVTAAAAITVALAVLSPATKPPTPSRDPSAILPVDPVAWADVVWTKVDDPVGLRAGPLGQRMDFVVAGGPGLVAGGMTSIGVPGAETALATIWVSETGDRWTPALFDAGVQAGDFASISKMAAGSRGIVAWGGVCCLAEEQAVWWSGDGIAWERRPLPDDFGLGSHVLQVAAGPDGFAAAGGNNAGMAIWTSADGRSWKPVDLGASGAPGSMLSSIRRTDDGWLAVGVRNNGNTIDGAVWRSSDLDGWQPIPDDLVLAGPEDVDLSEVHAFAGGYLATGITGAHEDRLHCEGVGGNGRRVAVAGGLHLSCGWGRRAEWWSADGATWRLLPPTMDQAGNPLLPARPDGRGLMDYGPVKAGGPGLVTIGYDFAGRNASEDIRGIWTTTDGRSWNPVGVALQFPPDASVSDMAIVGRRIVAVGDATAPPLPNGADQGSREDAAAWIGTVLP